jgi:hypothetical protein
VAVVILLLRRIVSFLDRTDAARPQPNSGKKTTQKKQSGRAAGEKSKRLTCQTKVRVILSIAFPNLWLIGHESKDLAGFDRLIRWPT